MECWAQFVAAHPTESIVALATIGVGTMVGSMAKTRLQALVNIVVLAVGHVVAKMGGDKRNGKS